MYEEKRAELGRGGEANEQPSAAPTSGPSAAAIQRKVALRKQAREHGAGTGAGAGSAAAGGDALGAAPTADVKEPVKDPTAKAKPTDTGTNKIYSEVASPAPSGKADRTSVGVGELVRFYAEAADQTALAGKWTGAGDGTVGKSADPSQMEWTAGSEGGKTFTATWTPSDASSTTKVFTMTTVAPKLKFDLIKPQTFPKGVQGAGMDLKVSVEPMAVSFMNVQWKESNVPATNITGYYAESKVKPPDHVANPPSTFGSDNAGPKDDAHFTGADGKLTEGGYDWVIPQAYIVSGKTVNLDKITQSCRMKDGGETTCSKAGQSATRKP